MTSKDHTQYRHDDYDTVAGFSHTRDVRNRFFYISVRFSEKPYSVRNEFHSVRFGSDIRLPLFTTHVIANITMTVDDMTLTSLATTTTSKQCN